MSVADHPEPTAQVDQQARLTSDAGLQIEAPDGLAAQLLALGHDCASRIAAPWRDLDHGDLLYDDKGLPR